VADESSKMIESAGPGAVATMTTFAVSGIGTGKPPTAEGIAAFSKAGMRPNLAEEIQTELAEFLDLLPELSRPTERRADAARGSGGLCSGVRTPQISCSQRRLAKTWSDELTGTPYY
jgi:hypothetical protein